jgi:4-hydroxy-tetrahydrodipicolinate reductase
MEVLRRLPLFPGISAVLVTGLHIKKCQPCAVGCIRARCRTTVLALIRLLSKVQMQIIVVGAGKLAKELLGALPAGSEDQVFPWAAEGLRTEQSIVVHAGSGRELDAITGFCAGSGRELDAITGFCALTRSPLVELSTGSVLEEGAAGFPVILCPNTNLLMLKFMAMLERSGHLFRGYRLGLVESHQVQKSSVPGTAVSMAQSLGLAPGDVQSVRDAEVQRGVLQIPQEHLARHAYHQVLIQDGACSVKLETRVYGDAAYADGVAHIVAAVRERPLENRRYSIMEFIDNGWL